MGGINIFFRVTTMEIIWDIVLITMFFENNMIDNCTQEEAKSVLTVYLPYFRRQDRFIFLPTY